MTEKKPAEHACGKPQTSVPVQSHRDLAFTLAAAAQDKLRARQRHRAATGTVAPRKTHEHRLSPSQQRGLQAESRAIAWLCAHGLQLLGTNLRCRHGELDAVFRADAQTLVIVEIRYRRNARHGARLPVLPTPSSSACAKQLPGSCPSWLLAVLAAEHHAAASTRSASKAIP
ncbi:hypothetical protein TKWG_03540 [Advenella kashmirensis WT001]|uniref:Uncharacterized protein n=1 Tax=Advenella kashmirensis (strain DSM 17095 / LMG 22695 / WT001) TaxID=1036672 RepID=I3U8F5_ADVKW|nr:hypothetical protein TKWG_03540 [Advenella kashmirensis WT001]